MKIGKGTRVASALVIAVVTVLPAPAMAQTSTTPGGTLPFQNTSGGAIAARRPGTWIRDGIATHATRQASALHQFGGANITAEEPTGFRDDVLTGLVNILLGTIQALSTLITTAIQAGAATTTAGT